MIIIRDEQFQIPAAGLVPALDRVCVVGFGADARPKTPASPGSPCMHADLAYGRDVDGAFVPAGYRDSKSYRPHHVDAGPRIERAQVHAAQAVKTALKSGNLAEAFVAWFEEFLVAEGVFGPNATVV